MLEQTIDMWSVRRQDRLCGVIVRARPHEKLRIGLLGASRIAVQAIIEPARQAGHRVVAVAARDRSRAVEFAARHGIERVHDGYQNVIDDPQVDLVYNALVNVFHAPWNIAALKAGKHVLSEKPITANAA